MQSNQRLAAQLRYSENSTGAEEVACNQLSKFVMGVLLGSLSFKRVMGGNVRPKSR